MSNAAATSPADKLIHTIQKFPPGSPVKVQSRVKTFHGVVAPGGYGISDQQPNEGRTLFNVYEALDSGELATHPSAVWADDAVRMDVGDQDDHGTTKRVTVVLTAKFVGSYFGADEVTGALEDWLTSGLDDRDDLRDWTLTPVSVVETEVSPEDQY